MRKLLFVMAFSLLAVACKEELAKVGQAAPEIAAVDLQGEPVKLDRWKGKSVYLNFWSLSCGVCLAEMPHLEALSKQYADKITVVAVNIDPEFTPLEGVIEKQGVTYAMLRDSLGMTKERYLVVGTPTSYMIDANGKLVKKFIGSPPAERLDELFAETARQL
ncbi:TlpA disulfide reductase family protein [Microvirga sp. W0021]|uniref:TlpA disulfide reductase family protein n=1 Tax=Hohaiivirga grylli TaxID=3133970 RepID=A0ABV0BI12_9HYPH